MIRLFQRRGDSARSELDELKRVLRCLRSSPAQTRLAVGAGVCLANTDFLRRFAGMQSFRQIPTVAQQRFYSQLSDLESSLRSREMETSVGVGLYRIWLAEMLAGRRDAAQLLGEELTELSRKGLWGRPPAGSK
jgi:hypothetical protein